MKTANRDDHRTNYQPAAVVVQLAAPAYESLDDAALERVRSFLLGLAEEPIPTPVIVDLSQVQFCGARFVGVLIDTWASLRKRHRRFAICGLTPYCARLIHVLHFDKLFNVYPTQQAAMQKLGWGFDSAAASEVSPMRVRVVTDEVPWDSTQVRVENFGDEGVPLFCEIVPRSESPANAHQHDRSLLGPSPPSAS